MENNNQIIKSLYEYSPGKIAMVIAVGIMMFFTGIGKIAKLFRKEKI